MAEATRRVDLASDDALFMKWVVELLSATSPTGLFSGGDPSPFISRHQIVGVTVPSTINAEAAKLNAESQRPKEPYLDLRARIIPFKSESVEQSIVLCIQAFYVDIAFVKRAGKKLAAD